MGGHQPNAKWQGTRAGWVHRAFFWKCWDIVKVVLMRANHHFSNLHGVNLQWLNSANIALLPQKEVFF